MEVSMNKRFVLCILLVMILVFSHAALFARGFGNIAIGAQAGFIATGIVVDIDLGPIALNAGVNYPLGWTYIAALAGGSAAAFPALFTVTADVTAPFPLGEDFMLKLGANTVAFTDFQAGIIGIAGACIKGEYWIPNRNYGLFVNLNVPVMAYGVIGELTGDDTASGMFFDPALPLLGLFTTTAGVLWSF